MANADLVADHDTIKLIEEKKLDSQSTDFFANLITGSRLNGLGATEPYFCGNILNQRNIQLNEEKVGFCETDAQNVY